MRPGPPARLRRQDPDPPEPARTVQPRVLALRGGDRPRQACGRGFRGGDGRGPRRSHCGRSNGGEPPRRTGPEDTGTRRGRTGTLKARPGTRIERGVGSWSGPQTPAGAAVRARPIARTPRGEDPATAVRHTVEFARQLEECGYHRFWVAEHHECPRHRGLRPHRARVHRRLAYEPDPRRHGRSDAAEPPAARGGRAVRDAGGAASRTDRHGTGTVGGFTRREREALGAGKGEAEQFGERIRELLEYFAGESTVHPGVHAVPAEGLRIPRSSWRPEREPASRPRPASPSSSLHCPVWTPWSSTSSGTGAEFRPSTLWTRPHVVVSLAVAVADTEAEARELLLPEAWSLVHSRTHGVFHPCAHRRPSRRRTNASRGRSPKSWTDTSSARPRQCGRNCPTSCDAPAPTNPRHPEHLRPRRPARLLPPPRRARAVAPRHRPTARTARETGTAPRAVQLVPRHPRRSSSTTRAPGIATSRLVTSPDQGGHNCLAPRWTGARRTGPPGGDRHSAAGRVQSRDTPVPRGHSTAWHSAGFPPRRATADCEPASRRRRRTRPAAPPCATRPRRRRAAPPPR